MSTSFEAMGAYNRVSDNLVGRAASRERLDGERRPPSSCRCSGARPLLGRLFTPRTTARAPPGTLAAERRRCGRTRFGGDPGVARPQAAARRRALHGHRRHAARLPLSEPRDAALDGRCGSRAPPTSERDDLWLECVARLRPGVSLETAQAEMRLVAAQLERAVPAGERRRSGRTSSGCATRSRSSRGCCCWPSSAPRSACC